ncbi:MAG TPA: hypothetical protein VII52_16505 [Gemmatimonadaceae bacterium]
MRHVPPLLIALSILANTPLRASTPPRIVVTVARSAHAGPLTGRLVLAIAKAARPEPRLLLSPRGPALFAIDIDGLTPGAPAVIDGQSLGYPRQLGELPPGDYFAQAIVNVYELVHRADGTSIWVHMNDGSVEFFNNAAGHRPRKRIRHTSGVDVRRLSAPDRDHAQPDPIDFTRYQMTNIYTDSNAFTVPSGPFTSVERGFQRTTDGQTVITTRELSRFEAVLGSHGRSGYQLEAWEAIYGPVGADGYPVPLWDKLTGRIDHAVASSMRDSGYDLRAFAERRWPQIGAQLVGKLHFSAGDMDDYWLNLAVYRFQDFLKTTANPHYEEDFVYGRPMKGHAWHSDTWANFIRNVAAAIKAAAPAGENTAAWSY